MNRDIEIIIQHFGRHHPDVQVEQLQVIHPADDDGLWFFRRTNEAEIQLESSSGNCPFLIESNLHNNRLNATTIEDVIQIIEEELDL
ncbi:MAG TPA: hypothetical protein VHO69_01175 [Phototrophicaceae bacterium]|nr:hypothetical protein [Phototrophicaceae bacterium]